MIEQTPCSPEQRNLIKHKLQEEILDAFAHAVGDLTYTEANRILSARSGQLASLLEAPLADGISALAYPSRYREQEITTLEVQDYSPAYAGARSVEEQLEGLNRDRAKWGVQDEFKLNECQRALLSRMDPHLEGVFLMPPYTFVDEDYRGAIEKLLKNFWNIPSLPFPLRDLEETGAKRHRLKDEWQKQGSGNLTLVWAQLGALYAGKSALRADELMLAPEEGPMGVYGFLSLLVTHPERMSQGADPAAICCGDEIPVAGSLRRESKVPVVSFFGDAPRFDALDWNAFARERGVPSMRIPHKVE